MAIVGQINVESRRYSGYLDPRYPIAYWQAALSVTGNGTGGALGIDLVFQQANGPARINSQIYSVERFSIRTSDGVTRSMRVGAINLGGPANLAFSHEYVVLVSSVSGNALSAASGREMAMLPLFLGSQRQAGQTASFSLITDNVDTIVFKFEAEGYRWSPRSVLVDGGPQRPPTGLYAR